jgi:hypothetical protein
LGRTKWQAQKKNGRRRFFSTSIYGEFPFWDFGFPILRRPSDCAERKFWSVILMKERVFIKRVVSKKNNGRKKCKGVEKKQLLCIFSNFYIWGLFQNFEKVLRNFLFWTDQMAGAEKKRQAQIFFNFHIWRISFLGFWFSNFEAPIRLRSAQILVSHLDQREFLSTSTPGVLYFFSLVFSKKKCPNEKPTKNYKLEKDCIQSSAIKNLPMHVHEAI